MLTIEEKLNRESSLRWANKKVELRKENEMATIEKFVDFFTEKIRKEENVSLVLNFTTRGDFKPQAKIFLNKMRPIGSKTKQFYKLDGEGSNSPNLLVKTYRKDSASFAKNMETSILDFVR